MNKFENVEGFLNENKGKSSKGTEKESKKTEALVKIGGSGFDSKLKKLNDLYVELDKKQEEIDKLTAEIVKIGETKWIVSYKKMAKILNLLNWFQINLIVFFLLFKENMGLSLM